MAFLRSFFAAASGDLAGGGKPNVQAFLTQRSLRSTQTLNGGNIMWFHAALATAVMTLAVTPACAAKITVSQYGRLVATLPWAVALQKNMFKEAGLDIDGITAGAGGGTSLRNMLAGELP